MEIQNDNIKVITAIHILCDRYEFSNNDTKLYSFIHMKISENCEEYFMQTHSEDIEALRFLINGKSNKKSVIKNHEQVIDNDLFYIPEQIKVIDSNACNDFGIEFNLSAELRNMLRMYTDSKFRKEKLDVYFNRIKPVLDRM